MFRSLSMRWPASRARAAVLGASCALAVSLLGACGGGDAPRIACTESVACECAAGVMSMRPCSGGLLGPCACIGLPGTMDGSVDGFGNADGSVALDASLDASQSQDTDARVIDVDTTCGEQESQAVLGDERPVDVIFIIDNSGSMSDEIQAVEQNINQSFAQIIAASGADYRVIMLTDHGSGSLDVCIDVPLASASCAESTDPAGSTLGAPANSERFFHYDINVQSTDSVCLMLSAYEIDPMVDPAPETGADAAPTGWHEWLRADALKVFVEITDDELWCTSSDDPSWSFTGGGGTVGDATQLARSVYTAILGLSEEQFGTAQEPKLIWHSIVGMTENDPIELPYTHFDPPELTQPCASAYDTGTAYQMLSISTAGLRYPVCAADAGHGFDAVFRAIAHEVVRGSRVECSFNIPTPPAGKFVDYDSVEVEYTPGAGGAVEAFGRVTSRDCDDHSFYYDDREIKLCAAACDRVRADSSATIHVVFGCGPEAVLAPDQPD